MQKGICVNVLGSLKFGTDVHITKTHNEIIIHVHIIFLHNLMHIFNSVHVIIFIRKC